jgi:histidine phosphotransferase ChpT
MSAKPIDVAMLEVLASKICHDLISPIGAVNNGVELIEDMGPDAGPEATALIAFSAQQASAKLQAFRMAYGIGGADSNIKPEDVHKAIELLDQPG